MRPTPPLMPAPAGCPSAVGVLRSPRQVALEGLRIWVLQPAAQHVEHFVDGAYVHVAGVLVLAGAERREPGTGSTIQLIALGTGEGAPVAAAGAAAAAAEAEVGPRLPSHRSRTAATEGKGGVREGRAGSFISAGPTS